MAKEICSSCYYEEICDDKTSKRPEKYADRVGVYGPVIACTKYKRRLSSE